MQITLALSFLIFSSFAGAETRSEADGDGDGDGLSDFWEVHKYGTDPNEADSDGDGVSDFDWAERREYAYTVRRVVHVLKPVTPEFLNDDYQDIRVLDEGQWHVELEVIHYPFNTVAETLGADTKPVPYPEDLAVWMEPGLTSDWDEDLRKALLASLDKDGINVAELSDVEIVKQVSKWLLARAKHQDGFTTFLTSFDGEGNPYMDDIFAEKAKKQEKLTGMSMKEWWPREISARGMFEHRTRGSCTSSAIYLSGCLRALGIPTRTVLCIPLIDASDERERALVKSRLSNHQVRGFVEDYAYKSQNAWASHTFNEVWVAGRWRRLNYDRLGQNILDANYMGLMTHIATFHDWADAKMADTVGRREHLPIFASLFGGTNPYSTIALSDSFGEHCTLENPKQSPAHSDPVVTQVFWTDSPQLPESIRKRCVESKRFGLILLVPAIDSTRQAGRAIRSSDPKFYVQAGKNGRFEAKLDPGCIWTRKTGAYLYLPLDKTFANRFQGDGHYRLQPRNEGDRDVVWQADLPIDPRTD